MVLAATTAPCPGCRSLLSKLVMPAGVVAPCDHCGGVWIDNMAGRWVMANQFAEAERTFMKEHTARARRRDLGGYRDSASTTRACPVCQHDLIAKRMRDPEVTVDVCAEHGTFFDEHELSVIVSTREARALQTEVDRVAQRASQASQSPFASALVEGMWKALFDPPRR